MGAEKVTPADLIQDTAEKLRVLFAKKKTLYKNAKGELVTPEVYEQTLPAPPENPQTPYVLVSLYNGEQPGPDSPREVALHIICQTYDDAKNMQGYKDGLNLLEFILQHIYGKTIIAGKYEAKYPCQFATLDGVTYPYFAAGAAIRVECAGLCPQNQKEGFQA
jgi:hypothetical protein